MRRRRDEAGRKQRHDGRQPEEGKAEQAGDSDVVKYAEEDEALGRRDAGGHGDGKRGAGDHRETPPIAPPPDAVGMGEKETDAGEEQEARSDRPGKELPAADRRQAGMGIAEEFEIPGKVVDRHGQQSDAARNVDGFDALSGLRLVWQWLVYAAVAGFGGAHR